MYSHILLATDGSERSSRAIKAGIQFAKALNARVTGLYVSEATYIHEVDKLSDPRASEALLEVSATAGLAGVEFKCVNITAESPQQAIVRFANDNDNDCDLIVMGTHGRSRVGKLLLGSAAASVLADCEIPVLLYR